jgi:PAS domain S-box-containing protein
MRPLTNKMNRPSMAPNQGSQIPVSTIAQTILPDFDERFLRSLEALPDAMVLSDRDGRIVLVNTNADKLFGYEPRDLAKHRELRAAYCANPSIRPMGVGMDVRACRKDGTEFPAEISLCSIDLEGRLFVWAAVRSIAERERTIGQLRDALTKKKILRGLISVCAWCKRIRDELGTWQDLETYIGAHSEAKFTHGLCCDCMRKLDPTRKPAGDVPADDRSGNYNDANRQSGSDASEFFVA